MYCATVAAAALHQVLLRTSSSSFARRRPSSSTWIRSRAVVRPPSLAFLTKTDFRTPSRPRGLIAGGYLASGVRTLEKIPVFCDEGTDALNVLPWLSQTDTRDGDDAGPWPQPSRQPKPTLLASAVGHQSQHSPQPPWRTCRGHPISGIYARAAAWPSSRCRPHR